MGHLGAGGHCRFSAQFKHGGGWPDLDLATSTGDGAIYEALGTAEPDEDPRGRRSPPMEPDSWIREKARQCREAVPEAVTGGSASRQCLEAVPRGSDGRQCLEAVPRGSASRQ